MSNVGSYKLLRSPLEDALCQFFAECERSVFIASPFVNQYGAGVLIDCLKDRIHALTIELLTNINLRSLQDGSLDLGSIVRLCQLQPLTKVSSLPRLHAKVYVVDEAKAVITSANFTRGGLVENYEYGIALFDRALVKAISYDMRAYARLGSRFTLEELIQLKDEAEELHRLQRAVEKRQRDIEIAKRWREQQRAMEEALLRNRVKDRPITAIFADTILYLLRSGPMTTQALHLRIREIHPDICDDTIDRVINGQRFGKLWKHHVRNAQQFLKRRGEIRYDPHTKLWSLNA